MRVEPIDDAWSATDDPPRATAPSSGPRPSPIIFDPHQSRRLRALLVLVHRIRSSINQRDSETETTGQCRCSRAGYGATHT
jgi:hypothetical protein